ncbi:predicted protein [Histoplasma capsulatum G186AR]|uniref:Uncharacterized protein n=1 Tax=Ajellomyces capsulatus (strain G186AR / H82 / ATCC MYA-2454 / RMSCC 2432) TaxID=447093 RepID=C0NJ32_AJECG|nr:uncharacterized protein HCBG_03162 [Histoplasma capsulatum G186AR]EEH07873.1 predicted protein [Histoplasma capsulatum G186AR]
MADRVLRDSSRDCCNWACNSGWGWGWGGAAAGCLVGMAIGQKGVGVGVGVGVGARGKLEAFPAAFKRECAVTKAGLTCVVQVDKDICEAISIKGKPEHPSECYPCTAPARNIW